MTNKLYCMSHYLAFRFIKDENINFFDGFSHTVFKPRDEKEITPVSTIDEMDSIIRAKINEFYVPNKTAILLSGGIDSAILASYLPEGTKAYTFKCIANGTIDETAQARKYCDAYKLDHEIIEMYWSDFEELTPEILKADGVPFHSIEVQLLKACKHAKSQGIDRIIYGDAADYVFGGMDKILSRDWKFDEFITRYNSIEPSKALKTPIDIKDVYEPYRKDKDMIDFQAFLKDYMDIESYTSYMHAFELGNVKYLDPFESMKMAQPLDLNRVRNGEPKYMVRELFKSKYPNIEIPTKIPMPRAMNQWLRDYKPIRDEFILNCTDNMTGDQKWLCWCLEQFLNMYDKGEL